MTSRFALKLVILAASTLALASHAGAEVRLLHRGPNPGMRITITMTGPWSPLGIADRQALNSGGDLVADSAPSIAVNGTRALVAWTRQDSGETALATSSRGEWRLLRSLPGSAREGQPRMAPCGDGFILLRTSRSGFVELATLDGAGVLSLMHPLTTGTLIGLAIVGSTVHVLVQDATGSLRIIVLRGTVPRPDPTPYRGTVPEPEPTPFLAPAMPQLTAIVALASGLPRLDAGTWTSPTGIEATSDEIHGEPVVRVAHVSALQAHAHASSHRGRDAAIEVFSNDSRGLRRRAPPAFGLVDLVHDQADTVLAHWWRDPFTLEFVVLSEDRVGDVRRLTSTAEYDPALPREALSDSNRR